MFIPFIVFLGTFPHVIHTNINNLTSGPRKNESARFIYQDPGSHKYAHCMFCDMKALTDSTYSYLQQPACSEHYLHKNRTDMMTSYEMDNKKYAFCISGDVPGCGNLAQMSEKSVPNRHWKCDAGFSNSINSVYFSCALIDDITQRVIWNWYCNETLQWQETFSAVGQLNDTAVVQLDDKDSITMIFVVTGAVTVTVTCVLLVIIFIYRCHSPIAQVCSDKDVCRKSLNDSYSDMCRSAVTPILEPVRPDTYGAEIESPLSNPSELKNKQNNTITVRIDNPQPCYQLGSEQLQLEASTCRNGARLKNFQSDNKSDGAHFQGLYQNISAVNSDENTSGYNSQLTRLMRNLDQEDILDIQSLVSDTNDDNMLVKVNGTTCNTVMNERQVAAIENDKHNPGSPESFHFSDTPIIFHRSTGSDEERASITQEKYNCNKEKRPEPLGISCEIPSTDEMKDDDAAHNTQPKETMTLAEAYESDATEDCTENSPLSVNELN